MIDPHVHLRDQAQAEKETIKHAASIAREIGYSALFDMPNTSPPLTTRQAIEARIRFGQNQAKLVAPDLSYCVFAGLTADKGQIREVKSAYEAHFPSCVGLKYYAGSSTGDLAVSSEDGQNLIYETLTALNYEGVLAVHCEWEALFQNHLWDKTKPETHSLVRGEDSEAESVKTQIRLAQKHGFKGTLHICHISTKTTIDLVVSARAAGMKITCGATPHHALLNTDIYKTQGIFAKVNPPIRAEKTQKEIFTSIIEGKIDWLESDHAPHTRADKLGGASGVPGFLGMLLLVRALRKQGLSEKRLQELCGGNINRTFGTNFPVSVPSESTIAATLEKLQSAYEYNPYEGF